MEQTHSLLSDDITNIDVEMESSPGNSPMQVKNPQSEESEPKWISS
jgi:hypothetical protein